MIYKAIGVMSGSSLDGLDIAFVTFTETGGKWTAALQAADCAGYDSYWQTKLAGACNLAALDYLLLHSEYGHFIGNAINDFIGQHRLHHQVNLVTSHGHTVFHMPEAKMTAQLGEGAAIAAVTGLPVITDLRAMDVALGGQGAPIVPMGEKLLYPGYDYYLNIGGIANISSRRQGEFLAWDICPANRVLNLLVAKNGAAYDDRGQTAATGQVNEGLLETLNAFDYYSKDHPKSLANSFGTEELIPVIEAAQISTADALRTYTEHIAIQVNRAVEKSGQPQKMLVTGGGAFNDFLMQRLTELLAKKNVEVEMPGEQLVRYKEAIIMALLGILRWREEFTVIPSVTGATRPSIGGAFWLG